VLRMLAIFATLTVIILRQLMLLTSVVRHGDQEKQYQESLDDQEKHGDQGLDGLRRLDAFLNITSICVALYWGCAVGAWLIARFSASFFGPVSMIKDDVSTADVYWNFQPTDPSDWLQWDYMGEKAGSDFRVACPGFFGVETTVKNNVKDLYGTSGLIADIAGMGQTDLDKLNFTYPPWAYPLGVFVGAVFFLVSCGCFLPPGVMDLVMGKSMFG